MIAFIKTLFSSKKFIAALGSVIAAGCASQGLDIETNDIMAILSPMMVYILGQGVADHGKEKAKIESLKQD